MKKILLCVVAVLMAAMTYATDVQSKVEANVVLQDGLTYYCQLVSHACDSIVLYSPVFEEVYGNSTHVFGPQEILEIKYLKESKESVYKRKNHFFTNDEYKLWKKTGALSYEQVKPAIIESDNENIEAEPIKKAIAKKDSPKKKKQKASVKIESGVLAEGSNERDISESENVEPTNVESEVSKDQATTDVVEEVLPTDSLPFTYELFTQYIERRQNTPLHKLNNIFLTKGYHGQVIVGSGLGEFIGVPFSISTIQGWRFNQFVFVGGGITLNFDCGGNQYFTMPMFADCQISIPARFENIYLVWDTQLGASPWCVMGEKQNYQPNATFKEKAKGGVYFSTGLNFMFGIKDGVSIGFKGQFVLLQNGYQGRSARIGVGGLGCFVVAY